MTHPKCLPLIVALLCTACPADGEDETAGATDDTTSTGPSTSASTTTPTTTEVTTTDATSTSIGSSTEESTSGETSATESSTGADTTGLDTSSETSASVCDVLGSGCHDIETKEAQDCHEIGHDADEAACEEAYEMCAEICGL